MNFFVERAREADASAREFLLKKFSAGMFSGGTDAVFLAADKGAAFGVTGLPYYAPVCVCLLNDGAFSDLFERGESLLLRYADMRLFGEGGEISLKKAEREGLQAAVRAILDSPGTLNGKGEHVIDLKGYPVGPHFAVNLLLGDRTGCEYPLFTTPKSAVDAFGRGSFRAGGATQVLASRYVLWPEENGEPVNRQFYLCEKGRRIFYSLDAENNVESAVCTHSQNRTTIEYRTKCGLKIVRTIFLLPQEEGMPAAVEAQRVEIRNESGRARDLKIVFTGAFGLCTPETIVNDVVYANVVHQSEVYYRDGKAAAVALHNKDSALRGEKKFALLLSEGELMDDFCMSLPEFIGRGTLAEPENLFALGSRSVRKNAPFFALGKRFRLGAGESRFVDSFAGISEERGGDVAARFDEELGNFIARYSRPAALADVLEKVKENWENYISYLTPETGDGAFDAYAGRNLPFQVLYQTFVSRAFAWTQKAYRETGFREIQDIYASMNYLIAAGKGKLVKELISMWASNVFRMGYAYHDFTWRGKEPGDCSDDQLWLAQAVYRYVKQTGDAAFLKEEFPVAGEEGKTRRLIDTLAEILVYSGKISVGKHGLPLLDKADWNDTLRLDKVVYKGPQKEALYREQLQKSGKPYGTAFENTLTESGMNACLLKIAADETAELAAMAGEGETERFAREISENTAAAMQKYAWKDGFFARALINDGREGGYTYLGAAGDGLSADGLDGTYYLNMYSWPILADIADEGQIARMLGAVKKYLLVPAGLKLCTLVRYELLGTNTATGLYYPGDRENGGVFKHAAMMATVASFRAAKKVKDRALADELIETASFMLDKVLPVNMMKDPFVLKGNPRFCTQYNNSITGENVGPILSGTASWLTLALYEAFGIGEEPEEVRFSPVPFRGDMRYVLRSGGTEIDVRVKAPRAGAAEISSVRLDGKPAERAAVPKDGRTHTLEIEFR